MKNNSTFIILLTPLSCMCHILDLNPTKQRLFFCLYHSVPEILILSSGSYLIFPSYTLQQQEGIMVRHRTGDELLTLIKQITKFSSAAAESTISH